MTMPTRAKPSRLCYRAVEFRAAQQAQTDGRTLEGYAAVFDTPTEIDSWEGTFQEVISRGAFKRTLNARMPVLQFDHGRDARTGTVPIGAIVELREDKTGLFVSARLFENDVVEPIRQAIEGGAIDGMSFRFRVVRDTWTDKDGNVLEGQELYDLLWSGSGDRGPITRTILEVELYELGPVVFPAYGSTSVGVRSMLAGLDDEERSTIVRELIGMLRDPADAPDSTVEAPEASQDKPTPPTRTSDKPKPPEPATRTSGTPTEPAKPGTSAPTAIPTERNTVMDPMTIEERASRQSEIRARLAELDTEFAGAELPGATQDEWDSLRTEYQEHERAIAAQEERRTALASLAERTGGERAEGNGFVRGRGYAGQGPAVHTTKDIFDLAALRQSARSPEEFGSIARDAARRAIELATFPGQADRSKAQEMAERTLVSHDDDEGTLARRFLTTGSPLYMRAFGKVAAKLSERSLTSEERASLAVGVDANGGFAVPFQLDPTIILTSDGAINPLRSISRVERVIGKEWEGVTSAGVTVSRAAEGAEVGDDSPTLAQPTVKTQRVQGFIAFTREIEQDWAQLLGEMNRLLTDAKDIEEAESFTLGDGTGVNAGGIVTTLTAGQEVTVSTGAGGFKVPDTLDALTEALPPRFRARGQWLANISVYNKIGALAAAAGYALDPWVNLVNGKPNGLIGYAKNEASNMTSDITTAGNRYLVFGDFQQFLIVDKLGMSVELVPTLFGASGRPTGQRGLYAIWRNNSKVLVPGAFRVAKAAA